MTEDEKKEKEHILKKAALEGAATEVVQRYGSAVKEYDVAYKGVDNETGKTLRKGLKSISKSKVNPEYEKQNLKQQAGFSAEVLDVADSNAENIINKNPNRKIRTDDINETVDPNSGKAVGGTNDQLFDHVELDSNGNIVKGSAAQMKFVGNTPDECYEKLMSGKYQKYFDADAKLEVPSDYYDKILAKNDENIVNLEKQYQKVKELGKNEEAEKIKEKIDKCKKLKKNLKKSTVSNKDAMQARTNPKLTTAKRITKVAHKAGLEQAKIGATVGGSVSLIQNIVSVVKGDKDAEEAAVDVCKDTGTAAVASYTTAFAGSVIKGGMQNSGKEAIRELAKTNIASTIVTSAVDMGKTFKKYFTGEIDGVECLEELGQSGVNQLSSAMFGALGTMGATQMFGNAAIAIGQIAIPIPVVGGMIGAMVGCALSSACYKELITSLKEAKLAHEERLRVEAECEKLIKMIKEYRIQVEEMVEEYLCEHIKEFDIGFKKMAKATKTKDVNSFIMANIAMQKKLGHEVQYNSFSEFNSLMNSEVALKL